MAQLERAFDEARRSGEKQAEAVSAAREAAANAARQLQAKEEEFRRALAAQAERARREVDNARSEAEAARAEAAEASNTEAIEQSQRRLAALEEAYKAEIASLRANASEMEQRAADKEEALKKELAAEKAKALADAKAAAEKAAEQLAAMDLAFEEGTGQMQEEFALRAREAANAAAKTLRDKEEAFKQASPLPLALALIRLLLRRSLACPLFFRRGLFHWRSAAGALN